MFSTGVKVQEVEKLYNKLAQGIKKFIQMQEIAHTWKVGGNDIIVLINIYPITMSDISTNKHSRPILCLSEIRVRNLFLWFNFLGSVNIFRASHRSTGWKR